MIDYDLSEIRETMLLKNCPFCGNNLNKQDPLDTLYPAFRWHNPDTEQEETVWHIVCQVNAGGCDCEVYGSSPQESIDNWNRRVEDDYH